MLRRPSRQATRLKRADTEAVDVAATADFYGAGEVRPPALGCASRLAGRPRTASDGTASAIKVWITMLHASGAVESMDGMTPVGTCGRGESGCFTVREGKHSAPDWTVEPAPTTAFYERGVSSPSFANVRMGDWVGALGTLLAGDTVTATKVDVGT
ncbi:MAG: hypothetical protein ABSF27_10025, partial [Candidatus Dormibacteria bacterium]